MPAISSLRHRSRDPSRRGLLAGEPSLTTCWCEQCHASIRQEGNAEGHLLTVLGVC